MLKACWDAEVGDIPGVRFKVVKAGVHQQTDGRASRASTKCVLSIARWLAAAWVPCTATRRHADWAGVRRQSEAIIGLQRQEKPRS